MNDLFRVGELAAREIRVMRMRANCALWAAAIAWIVVIPFGVWMAWKHIHG